MAMAKRRITEIYATVDGGTRGWARKTDTGWIVTVRTADYGTDDREIVRTMREAAQALRESGCGRVHQIPAASSEIAGAS